MPDKFKLTKTTVDKLPFTEKGKQIDYFDTELPAFRCAHFIGIKDILC